MTLVRSKNGGLIPAVLSDFFNADDFFPSRSFPFDVEETIPSANVKESDAEFTIELAAPGFDKKDFKVDLHDDVLTVSAEKKAEKSEEKDSFRRREFSYNSFSRSFTLPKNVHHDNVHAAYENW
jgi:HSP20 family protein